MPRTKLEFSEKDLQRPTNFIIVLADKLLDTSDIDISQGESYSEHFGRRSIIITNSKSFGDIQKVSYRNIMNAAKPVLRRVDTHNDEYMKVYQKLLKLYKNGLMICHADTLKSGICQLIAETKDIGVDVVLYRDSPVTITPSEGTRANFMRIHYNKNFAFSFDYIEILSKMFGQDAAYGITLCQFIANSQHDICQKYFTETSLEIARDGVTDFIDTRQYTRQLAFHVYYDLVNNRITGFSRDKCVPYIAGLFDQLQLKWTNEEVRQVRDQYFPEQKV